MDNTFEWREEETNKELQGTIAKKGAAYDTMSGQEVTPIGSKIDSINFIRYAIVIYKRVWLLSSSPDDCSHS